MRLCYISNAVLGSRNASAVHVVKMCNALSLWFESVLTVSSVNKRISELTDVYGGMKFKCIAVPSAIYGFFFRALSGVVVACASQVVYSRWTPFILFYPLLFGKIKFLEFHTVPRSYLFKKGMSIIRLCRTKIYFTFISKKLKHDFVSVYPWINDDDCFVLPDAADPLVSCVEPEEFAKNRGVCGYVGSFAEGKGIETILALGMIMPEVTFIVVGGSDNEVTLYRSSSPPNVKFMGYVQPSALARVYDSFSIALLPNRRQVIIEGSNIGEWTSPMKMFEYMAAGKVIVASDLPVLKEILTHDENCLLVDPDNLDEWAQAIRLVTEDAQLAFQLASKGFNDLVERYSWGARAQLIRNISDLAISQ